MEQYETYPIAGIVDSYALALVIGVTSLVLLDSAAGDEVVPDTYSMAGESLYHSVLEMVHAYAGPKGGVYFPLLLTLFVTILISNLLGMLPYSFAAFSQLVANLSLGVALLGGLLILGALRHRSLLLGFFAPAGTPLPLLPLMVVLEVVSLLTRTFALGLRLAVNMITGHTLVKVVGGFIWLGYLAGLPLLLLALPIGLLAVLMCLEILIAYLQAYIFVFITCLTLKELSQTHNRNLTVTQSDTQDTRRPTCVVSDPRTYGFAGAGLLTLGSLPHRGGMTSHATGVVAQRNRRGIPIPTYAQVAIQYQR